MVFLPERKLEILSYDLRGPEIPENVASIEIKDPQHPQNSFCVGFKLIGSNPKDPKSWRYDHTNYYCFGKEGKDEEKVRLVPKKKIEKVLRELGTNLDELLEKYCELISFD